MQWLRCNKKNKIIEILLLYLWINGIIIEEIHASFVKRFVSFINVITRRIRRIRIVKIINYYKKINSTFNKIEFWIESS